MIVGNQLLVDVIWYVSNPDFAWNHWFEPWFIDYDSMLLNFNFFCAILFDNYLIRSLATIAIATLLKLKAQKCKAA